VDETEDGPRLVTKRESFFRHSKENYGSNTCASALLEIQIYISITYVNLQKFLWKLCDPNSRLFRNRDIDSYDMSFLAMELVKYMIRSSSVSIHAANDIKFP
jgi:hypothetical protein